MNEFGTKYTNKDDIDHLIKSINNKITIKSQVDWTSFKHIRFNLDLDSNKKEQF